MIFIFASRYATKESEGLDKSCTVWLGLVEPKLLVESLV